MAPVTKVRLSGGALRPVPASRTASRRQASGAANTKRADVAPQVLSVAFSRFCNTERRFCRKAAAIVMGIQSSIGRLDSSRMGLSKAA